MKIEYIYFPEEKDYSELLKEKVRDFKVSIEKRGEIEVLAKSEYGIIGKVNGIEFIVAKNLSLPEEDVIKKTVIILEDKDDLNEDFILGKISFSDSEIYMNCKFDENFFYYNFPLFDISLTKATLLIEGNEMNAKDLNRKSDKLIKKLNEISNIAKKSDSISELERIVSDLSTLQLELFTKFSTFKEYNEEIFSSLNKTEYLVRKFFPNTKSLNLKVQNIKDRFEYLRYTESLISQTIDGVRDVLTLIKLRLDILRNREFVEIQKSLNKSSVQNVEMQKKTTSLQAAAVVIEFVAVFYYTLKSWEHFLRDTLFTTPPLLRFLILLIFTFSVIYFTKILAKSIEKRSFKRDFIISTFILLLTGFLLYLIPFIFSKI